MKKCAGHVLRFFRLPESYRGRDAASESVCAPFRFYLRPSLASIHSVAWGTFIRRSLGMSLPVVLQMP